MTKESREGDYFMKGEKKSASVDAKIKMRKKAKRTAKDSETPERKKAEEQIKALSRFPSENPNPVMRISKDGIILYCNEAGSFILNQWKCQVGQLASDSWRQLVADVFQSGTKREFEEEHGTRTFSFVLAPIGEAGYVNIYGRDVTERKKAEEALRESEEKYRQIIETTEEGVWMSTPDGVTVFVNQKMADMLGYAHEEIMGKFGADFLSKGQEYAVTQFREELRKGMRIQREFQLRRKDGAVLWTLANVSPILGKRGEHVANLAMHTDITERKKAEEAIRKAHDELEMRVEERTKELTDASTKLQAEIAERKRAEEGMKAERKRFIDVLEKLPAYLVLLTPDYHVSYANRFFRERFGEDQGRHCFGYLFGRTEPCENCETYKTLETMSPREWEWAGPDGHNYYIYDAPFTEPDGSTRILEVGIDITEHKKAEKKLHAASLYARSLIEASLDPLVTISAEGKITDVNKATEEATGFSREQLIGSDFSDYFTEPEKARAGYQKVFTEGFVTDYPLAIRHKNGKTTNVLYNATLFKNEAGEIQGVFAAARDVTAQKQAEEKLRAASLYSRSLIEASLDPLVTISAEGKITDVNKATEDVTGLTRGQLIGSDFSDYFTDPEEARKGYMQVFKEGFVIDYPLAIRHKSGKITDVLYNATVYRNAAGKVQGIFAAARDITERKRAEEELRKAHDELEMRVDERTRELREAGEQISEQLHMLELAPVIVMDPNDEIMFWNKGAEAIYGLTEKQAKDKIVHELLQTEFPEPLEEIRNRLFRDGEWQGELKHKKADGTTITVASHWLLHKDRNNNPTAIIEVNNDITGRKKTEENLKYLSASSEVISSSLDSKTILENVAKLTVPAIADWCTIDMVDENGSINLIAVNHQDPKKIKWAYELRNAYPLKPDGSIGVPNVIRTGKPEIYPNITDAMLTSIAKNDEELRILRSVGYSSVMIVPIKSGSIAYGAITFVTTAESGRHFSDLDLNLATDVARRIALALDNSKLYQNQLVTKEKLRGTNTYLDSLINYANAPIIVWNPEFRITKFNHAFERLTGLAESEVLGKDLSILFPEDRKEEAIGHIRRTLIGEQWETVEIPILHADGTVKIALWNSANIYDSNGKTIIATIAQGQDITERKEAERALRKSERDLNRAQAVAKTGSWQLNLQREKLLWSDESYHIFGIPRGTPMTYETFLSAVHPDDREYVDQKWKAALQGGPYDIEHRIIVNGEIKWVRERAELELDKNIDGLRGGFGTVQDITERKKTEQALYQSKQEWERTFDSVPDLIAIVDDQHKIVRVNRAMAQQLGKEPEQCVGLFCYECVHGLNQPIESCPHMKTLQDGQQHMAELHEDRLGGDFLVSTTPLRDEKGQMIGSVHVARNITERKKMEAKLEEYARHLEELVEEKTRQLKDSERLATIGQTAAMVGHDIRNPLQSIEGATYLAKEELKSLPTESNERRELDEIITLIEKETNYIDHIVSDLQDFSRTPIPQPREADAQELILESLSTIDIPENIEVETIFQQDLPTLTVDPVYIKRVLVNLIENAVQAMPNGGKLTVKAFCDKESACMCVEDTGAGIQEQNKPRIFSPLFTTRAKGQGFGLSVCKKLVEAHDGVITFESQAEKGTQFTVKLPLKKKPNQE